MNAESNRLCGDCGKNYTGHQSMVCPHEPKPTPPATPAEMPECVRKLLCYIEAGGNRVLVPLEKLAAAVRDHYAKGGQ